MEPEFRDNRDGSRYEILLDGSVAGFIDYRASGDLVELLHTEVDSAYEGRGVGGRLARSALDDLRGRARTTVPTCPFIAGYIRRHPEYLPMVASSHRCFVEESG
ncbi:putative GNAT family acetyltransferase [Spinactinospora alkalitolerans]|uniref:Putative GNAT family acetyltransferase n=1 Tax=Spinactinospora alkalitolerans TaxID=687207 RepID=A0A852TYT2_9ACTN|nr:GNAT family N-acetyltransferase [Spinactinospora alkalitolerans]NYE49149.1 putative GNAT family acetyltransferase [Spinactinospora alkalitolerans]